MGLYQVSVLFFYTVCAMTSDNVLNLSSVQNVTAKLNFQVGAVSSDYLQECRNPHASSYPCLKTSSKTWANPSLSWVASKECLPEGPQLFPSSAGVYGYCSSAEDVRKTDLPAEVGAGQSDAVPRRFHNHKSKTKEAWKFQSDRAVKARPGLHGDPVQKIKMPSATGVKPDLVTEKPPPQESGMSQVPLKLQIKVSGQRGTLGISIAGGKGSLPYKDHDEGIFISRVTKGGASEKAGICVGDRLLEVNGLNMQGATHHEAVSALRNAGSCIKMKVLRERPVAPEVCDLERPQDPVMGPHLCSQDGVGHRGEQSQTESAEDRWLKKVEAVVCNGNSIVDLKSDQRKTLSDLEMAVLTKMDSLQAGKHTMTIPRIILTHPSTSDEDVELLTQIPSRERLQRFPDRRVYPDCFDSAFYPP